MGHLPRIVFYAHQWSAVPPLESIDLAGQTVLVVGANVGLGFEAAKHLARMKPGKLVLACRSVKKGEDAAKEITKATGFSNISCYALDLSVFSSVVAFAEEFERGEGRLDIFLYNAAINLRTYEPTSDGWESTLQVNDLSCALLSVLLVPLVIRTSEMTASAPHRPRVVIVTSETHYWVKFTPEELASPKILEKLTDADYCRNTPAMMRRYYTSKLINVLFTRELAERVSPSSAIVNCVNPGMCHSSLGRNLWKNLNLLQTVVVGTWYNLNARPTEAGGRQLAWAATGARHREQQLHGRFITDMEVREESDFAVSEEGYETQRRLWDETVEILSRVSPRFKEIVETYLSK